MRTLLGGLLFFLFLNVQGQEITVLDEQSREPLPGVVLYNIDRSKTELTNLDGQANISKFSSEEIIIFKHVSHKTKEVTRREIEANNNVVLLLKDENQLKEVVLSAARFAMEKKDVPQQIVSLSSEDIQLANPQTSADLLESSGQVYVQKSQLGGGSPMIRGFSTNRLLLTVDGVRMNNAIFRGGNVQNVISIDPLAIDKTEVILGPGSVIYGSDAVGGVMNFYTLKPKFSFDKKNAFSGNAMSRYATASNEKTAHADFNIGFEKWAFLTSISYSDFGDLEVGSEGPEEFLRPQYVIRRNGEDLLVPNPDPAVQKPTGYEQLSLLEKIRFMPNERWDFSLGLNYSTTSNFPRYDRLSQYRNGTPRSAEWYYGPQTWFMGNLKVNQKGNGALYDNAQFTAAYQYFKESRNNRGFGEDILFNSEDNVDAWSGNLDFEKDFEESRLFYGLEYIFNEVHSRGKQRNIVSGESAEIASRYPDGSQWQSMAVYLNYQWKFSEDLSLQAGVRYNEVLIDAQFQDEFYDFPFEEANLSTGALTGNVGLSWIQNETLSWKLNVSTAFRAPNIDDIGKVFDSEPGAVVVPNPYLKPEYAYNGELGTNINLADNIRLEIAGFYTQLKDAMVRRNFSLDGETEIEYQGEISRVQAIQNAAEAFVYGFEGGLEIDFSVALRVKSQISLTEGKEKQESGTYVPLRHAAPLFGNTHLIWYKKRIKLDLFSEYNGSFENEELAPAERNKPHLYALDENGDPYFPGWYTINLNGQYEISDNWVTTVSLENITDQLYRTYSSGIAAPGRNVIFSVRYSF